MAAVTRCDCHDLLVEDCQTLLRADARRAVERAAELAERDRLLNLPGVFHALWPGACAGCGERFSEGDPIRRYSKHVEEGYVGPCCVEARVR